MRWRTGAAHRGDAHAGPAATEGFTGRGGHRSGRRSRPRWTTPAKRNTRALVIGRGGHIVFEKYWGDTTLDTPVDLPDFTPVLAPLLVGSAMNDRLIEESRRAAV